MNGLATIIARNNAAAANATVNPAAQALITRAIAQEHVADTAADLIRAINVAMPQAHNYPADRVDYRAARKRAMEHVREVVGIKAEAEGQARALRNAAKREIAA